MDISLQIGEGGRICLYVKAFADPTDVWREDASVRVNGGVCRSLRCARGGSMIVFVEALADLSDVGVRTHVYVEALSDSPDVGGNDTCVCT